MSKEKETSAAETPEVKADKTKVLAGAESEKLQLEGYTVVKIYRGEDGKKYHDLVKNKGKE